MPSGLKTAGARSSEFLAAAANVVAQVALAWTNEISAGSATKYSVVGAVAYIVSRGLAKYEQRPPAAGGSN